MCRWYSHPALNPLRETALPLSAQVRRPHASDEVVANLAKYNSTILSADYLHDADQVVSRWCLGGV